VQAAQSVAGALQGLARAERLSADNMYRCDRCVRSAGRVARACLTGGRCGQHSQAVRQTTVRVAPRVLTLTLKRYSTSAVGGKIGRYIQYQGDLDLAPVMSEDADVRRLWVSLSLSVCVCVGDGSF
jgi:ubiquitin C-terminal hydrolase